MTTLAASAGQAVLIVIAAVAIVALATWVLKRRRRDVWRELARRRGLTFVEPSDGPRVRGQMGGRTVSVFIEDAGSDRDVGGVEVVRMSVSVDGAPPGMTAAGIPGLIAELAALAEERIPFDDQHFHHHVLVRSNDEIGSRAYWNEARRQAFLNLVKSAPCDQVTLREGVLAAELREIVSDLDQLERLLDLLLTTAPRLDDRPSDQED